VRALWLALALCAVIPWHPAAARADAPADEPAPRLGTGKAGSVRDPVELGVSSTPYASELRGHLYARLHKSPARAFGYELLVPGLGYAYAGFRVQAVLSAVATVAGAGLWLGGALSDHDALSYAGIATFATARVVGVAGAPIAAALLNAAFRRRLGVFYAF
jgi:hypothetical protein